PAGYDLGMSGVLDRDLATVAANERGRAGEVAADHRGPPLTAADERPPGDELVGGPAVQLVAAVAEELEITPVDLDVAAPLVEQHHRVARPLEGVPEQPGPAGLPPVGVDLCARCGRHLSGSLLVGTAR